LALVMCEPATSVNTMYTLIRHIIPNH
jgi:hypothetical protein